VAQPEPPVGEGGAGPSLARLARGVSWTGAGHVTSQVLWFVSLLVVATLVPPRGFGVVAFGMVLVTTAALLVDSGTRGSVIAAPSLTREAFRGAVVLNLLVGAIATVAIAALAGPLTAVFSAGGDANAVRCLSLAIFLYAAGIAPVALLQKELRFGRYAFVTVTSSAVASVVAVVAALLDADAGALVARQLVWMALLSALGWIAARDVVLAPAGASDRRRLGALRQPGWVGFLVFAATDYIALNADFVVVGGVTDAERLGVYSLAFALAFAPLTQFSWQVGRVLFPAAAATADLGIVGDRTVRSLSLMALLLLPLVPPVVVLAPVVLPALLSPAWEAIVTPFQLLVIAGVGHGVIGVIGESLSGTGRIGFRARVNVVWTTVLVAALLLVVPAIGITGAALAHLLLFLPLAAAYCWPGARLVGTGPRAVCSALAGILAATVGQGATTAGAYALLTGAGATKVVAAIVATAVGLAVAAALLARLAGAPVRDARSVITAALRRSPAATAGPC
jgi:O-antigen/teichoic acid export membrane protein